MHEVPTEEGRAFERDELVRSLRARERFLTGILDTLEAFVTIDHDWRLTYVNAAAARLLGRPVAQLLGRDVREFTPLVLEQAHLQLEKAMREAADVEFDAFSPSGTTYRLRARPLDGGGLALYVRDATDTARADRERRAATEALRESEERYRQLFQAESDAVLLIDQESGRVLEANAAAEAMYGYSAAEFAGLTDLELSAEPAQTQEVLRTVTVGETVVVRLRTHRRKDGSVFPVELTGRMFRLQGRLVRVAAIRDVSARRRAEEALKENEELFRAIFDQSGVGKAQADPVTGRFQRVNQAFCRLTGYDEEELLRRTFYDTTHPDDRAAEAAKLQALREGRITSYESEKRFVRPDGGVVWGLVSINVVRDSAGRPQSAVAVVQDITAHKLAEEALRESEERFRIMFEGHLAAMLLIEPVSGRILDANLAAARFYGYSREELRALCIQHLNQLPPEEVAAERIRAADGTNNVFVFPHRLASGEIRSVEVYASPVTIQGRPALFSVIHDITERLRAEAALLESEARHAGEQERMRLARDLHDSVTQALFAANLKAEALTHVPDLDPRAQALAADTHRLNRGALAQMRTLLLELRGTRVEDVALGRLLRQLVEAAQGLTRTEISLQMEGEGATLPPDVHAAVYRVAQEALNNVAKHAGAAHAEIRLRLGEDEAHLEVQDGGGGFDPAQVAPGHMGLKSMRERAGEVGALLTVQSQVGQGTLVALHWPADAGRQDRAGASSAPRAAGHDSSP